MPELKNETGWQIWNTNFSTNCHKSKIWAIIGDVIGKGEGASPERGRRINDDIQAKSLEGKNHPPDHLANGFIFFPGEVETAGGSVALPPTDKWNRDDNGTSVGETE